VQRQHELAAAGPAAEQPLGKIGMQAPTAPVAPQPHQQHNEPHRNRLRARDLLRDFEQDSHEVYYSPQANLGVALAALGQLEDTPAIWRLQAHIRVATTQVEESSTGYSRSATSSYSRVDQNTLASDIASMVPLSLWLNVDGVFWYTKHVHYTLVWICLWN
jgi:hypothetical protein